MAKQGDDLVRQMSRQVASEQGGTNHEAADRKAAAASPDRLASDDLTKQGPNEDLGDDCCDDGE